MRDVAYVALGSNLGDRHANLAFARDRIARIRDTQVVAQSDVEETEPITADAAPQEFYLNQMLAVATNLSPVELLRELQSIENDAGRVRQTRWGPRTLDLDIVAFEHQTADTAELRVPHPQLPRREFWRRELEQVRSRQ